MLRVVDDNVWYLTIAALSGSLRVASGFDAYDGDSVRVDICSPGDLEPLTPTPTYGASPTAPPTPAATSCRTEPFFPTGGQVMLDPARDYIRTLLGNVYQRSGSSFGVIVPVPTTFARASSYRSSGTGHSGTLWYEFYGDVSSYVHDNGTPYPQPSLLEICRFAPTVTPNLGTPTLTRTPTNTRTATSTSTPTPSPTSTSTNTPTWSPAPTVTPVCSAVLPPPPEIDCDIWNNQRTQIALQETDIALQRQADATNTAYVPTIPIPAPTGVPNYQTPVALLCERDPCASVQAAYGGLSGTYALLVDLQAPDCSAANFSVIVLSGWFVLPESSISQGFCLFIYSTTSIRNIARSASLVVAILALIAYYILTIRRLGDV